MVVVITAAIYQHLIKTIDSHVFSARRPQKTFTGDSAAAVAVAAGTCLTANRRAGGLHTRTNLTGYQKERGVT